MSGLFPLRLRGVTVKRFGKRLLGPLDLDLAPGGTTVIIGPNGSGKTTLLRAMHGIERLTAGRIDWAAHAPERHSFVFQSPIVLRRSVAENLAYPLRLAGQRREEIAAAVEHWLSRIGLASLRSSPAPRLSGGERQKLAIARALIRAPDVLFLDEPCANLDGHTTQEIETLLQETAAAGTRLVMATHDMGQARRLAETVIFLHGGTVGVQGPAEALFESPGEGALAAFLRGDIVK